MTTYSRTEVPCKAEVVDVDPALDEVFSFVLVVAINDRESLGEDDEAEVLDECCPCQLLSSESH